MDAFHHVKQFVPSLKVEINTVSHEARIEIGYIPV